MNIRAVVIYLIPDFLHIWIILNNDSILNIWSWRCWSTILICIVVCWARHAARVEEDFKCGTQMSSPWFHVHAMLIAVEAFREDHTVEWTIEFDVHSHVCFFALNLKMFNLRIVWGACKRPRLFAMTWGLRHWCTWCSINWRGRSIITSVFQWQSSWIH